MPDLKPLPEEKETSLPQLPPQPEEKRRAKRNLPDTLHSKRKWLMLAILLFLLAGGTLVPVGRIPLLRNLVYAMGYSPEETMRFSLFQALFSWKEHNKMLQGEIPDPNELSVFSLAEEAARAAGQNNANRRKSGLLNIKATNSARRQQGRGAVQVVGSSGRDIRDEREKSEGISLNTDKISVNTDANGSQIGDVYFGADSNVIPRDKRDGYNSTKILKKVANAPLGSAGSSSSGSDWFMRTVNKAISQDAQMDGLRNFLEGRGLAAGLGKLKQVGRDKASRDLYWAWLTGRAARRAREPGLKKTLAAAGFNGANLPRTVFTVNGFSGIGINPEDVIRDLKHVEDYVELDKECKTAWDTAFNEDYSKEIKNMRSEIRSVGKKLPTTCEEVWEYNSSEDEYRKAFEFIQMTCKEMKNQYGKLQTTLNSYQGKCGTIQIPETVNCDLPSYANQAQSMSKYCAEWYVDEVEKKKEEKDCANQAEAAQDACNAAAEEEAKEEIQSKGIEDVNKERIKNEVDALYTQEDMQKNVNGYYFDNPDEKEDPDTWAFNGKYIPGISGMSSEDIGHSLWVDDEADD